MVVIFAVFFMSKLVVWYVGLYVGVLVGCLRIRVVGGWFCQKAGQLVGRFWLTVG